MCGTNVPSWDAHLDGNGVSDCRQERPRNAEDMFKQRLAGSCTNCGAPGDHSVDSGYGAAHYKCTSIAAQREKRERELWDSVHAAYGDYLCYRCGKPKAIGTHEKEGPCGMGVDKVCKDWYEAKMRAELDERLLRNGHPVEFEKYPTVIGIFVSMVFGADPHSEHYVRCNGCRNLVGSRAPGREGIVEFYIDPSRCRCIIPKATVDDITSNPKLAWLLRSALVG